jgi:nitronate monooxygenase
VAAVAQAGALGFLAAGYRSVDGVVDEITRTRKLTRAPFGVNVFVPAPTPVDQVELEAYIAELAPEAERLGVVLGEPLVDDDGYAAKLEALETDPVAVVSFTFGAPQEAVVRRLHAAGSRVVVTVTGAEEAAIAVATGADALCVQGSEAGGHHSRFRNDESALSPAPLRQALASVRAVSDLPLIGAGGVADGEQVAAVRRAGAVAVQIGTALLAADEAGTNPTHRAALADLRSAGTQLTRAFTGRPARGIRNRFMVDHPDAPAAYPQIHHVTRPLRAAAAEQGSADALHLWAGVGYASTRAEPAGATIRRIVEEWLAAPGTVTGTST